MASRWVRRLGCVHLSRRSQAVMFVRSPNSRRLDVMMYAMVVRRLKPGAYERFRRALGARLARALARGNDEDLDRAQRG